MELRLDDRELRVLGCLIEKELTTPEYYPLSLNSLTNACNQKSNRNPVVSYDEAAVEQALEGLQSKNLARKTNTAGSRVDRHLHTLLDRFDLSRQEVAVLCELMLRGPQTVGELRGRADRMSPFENLDQAEEALRGLMQHDPVLVILLPREQGRKERRYMQLFSGAEPPASASPLEEAVSSGPAADRISMLEQEIASVRTELQELKQAFAEFRAQF